MIDRKSLRVLDGRRDIDEIFSDEEGG